MPTFHCITENTNDDSRQRYEPLESACRNLGINFNLINAQTHDLTTHTPLTKQDLLYRATPGDKAKTIEQYLLNPHCTTFYKSNTHGISYRRDTFFFNHSHNLPTIPTVPILTNNRATIDAAISYLDGFPLITKITGSCHGVGVIKIDSASSLYSLIDFLVARQEKILLRQFIKHERQARIIVLGDQVVGSHQNLASTDFRTNVGENQSRRRETITFSQEIQSIAVQAVQSAGLEFGGVDILFDENDQPHIAEVNFPCYYIRTQELTGIDIAEAMVNHLLKKSQS